jgi:hypothetical protein
MMVGTRSIAPVISAPSSADAYDRAVVLGEDLVQRRPPPWMRGGDLAERVVPVTVGKPRLLHKNFHNTDRWHFGRWERVGSR